MRYSDAKIKSTIRTGGGLGVRNMRPRKKGKGILSMLSSTPKRRRAGSTIKGYFF